MPCDLGYRSVARVRIETPAPETIESRTRAPEIDAELMERLGQEDPSFLAWLEGLDTTPLLEKALERALRTVAPASSAEFSIKEGALASKATVRSAKDKAKTQALFKEVGRRWQLELLRIVGEILDFALSFETTRAGGREVAVLEGEKTTSAGVREFLRITCDAAGGAEIRFEHYKSPAELEAEEDRFRALTARLGVRIVIVRRNRSGQDIPEGAVHVHPHKGKGKT